MRKFENINTGESIAREDVKESEKDYNGRVMILEVDKDGLITYTNRNFRDTIGYSREEIIGLPFDISHHPDMPHGICQQALGTAADGKIWAGYLKTITREGEYLWVSACVQAKYDPQKNMVGYVIHKKLAEPKIIEKVQEEYAIFKDSDETLFRSEYCGELHSHQR